MTSSAVQQQTSESPTLDSSVGQKSDHQTSDNPTSDNYERIAAAIAYLQKHYKEQPSLTELAQHIGLSNYHFQRLFTQWAGISPKRFLQYLTLEHAKAHLLDAKSLLDLSADVGLSGPSRLHDLFVNLEAMSPGEYRSGGADLTIHFGIHSTLFGPALVATTARGICALQFFQPEQLHHEKETLIITAKEILGQSWPKSTLVYQPDITEPLCDQIFRSAQQNPSQPLTVLVKGTNFQVQVWRALLTIPSGQLTTYSAIAQVIERPSAVRAVGTAIGRNPVGYLIPCHRVIRGSGHLGGYHWGLDRKAAILGWEASQQRTTTVE